MNVNVVLNKLSTAKPLIIIELLVWYTCTIIHIQGWVATSYTCINIFSYIEAHVN